MSLKFIEISRNLSHPAKMKLCAQKAEKPFWSYLALPTLNGPYQALLDINICAASRLFFWSLKTVEFKNTFWHKIFSYYPGSVMATPKTGKTPVKWRLSIYCEYKSLHTWYQIRELYLIVAKAFIHTEGVMPRLGWWLQAVNGQPQEFWKSNKK